MRPPAPLAQISPHLSIHSATSFMYLLHFLSTYPSTSTPSRFLLLKPPTQTSKMLIAYAHYPDNTDNRGRAGQGRGRRGKADGEPGLASPLGCQPREIFLGIRCYNNTFFQYLLEPFPYMVMVRFMETVGVVRSIHTEGSHQFNELDCCS
jgi:hypothetical protein